MVSFGTFPKTVCTLLYCWSCYAVLFKAVPVLESSQWVKILAYLFYIVEFGLALGLYWMIILDGPHFAKDVPELQAVDERQPPSVLIERAVTAKNTGGYRLCTKCNVWKPDRCHHCSSCGKCVLKMDHHCPWFGECIGYGNLRWFIQFLIHSCIYLAGVTIVCGLVEYQRVLDCSLHVLLAGILAVVFFVCMLVMFFLTSYQILQGRTTIESYESQNFKHSGYKNVFDLGKTQNWKTVMGKGWIQWVFPVSGPFDAGKGLWFRTVDGDLIQRLSTELMR